jgi:hypothetical protein
MTNTDVFTGQKKPGKGCEMSSRKVQFVLNLCRAEDQRAANQRQPSSSILNRLNKLPAADQNLLNLALHRRHSFRQIAALVGSNPGSVCRRVTMLTKRLSHPLVIALLERPLGLSEKFIDIGLKRHLFHHGIRRMAAANECSEREIRSTLHYLERWLRLTRQLHDENQLTKPNAQHARGECECVTKS